MHSLSPLLSLAHISLLLGIAHAQDNGIDIRDKMEWMEHILVDNNGTNNDGFMNAVTPCLNYVGFGANGSDLGEQSSAEWVRVAYHDFVTGDLSTGLGYISTFHLSSKSLLTDIRGLDASVGFESDRVENAGLFINDTLRFFSPVSLPSTPSSSSTYIY